MLCGNKQGNTIVLCLLHILLPVINITEVPHQGKKHRSFIV
jgi:hypothetical protein